MLEIRATQFELRTLWVSSVPHTCRHLTVWRSGPLLGHGTPNSRTHRAACLVNTTTARGSSQQRTNSNLQPRTRSSVPASVSQESVPSRRAADQHANSSLLAEIVNTGQHGSTGGRSDQLWLYLIYSYFPLCYK